MRFNTTLEDVSMGRFTSYTIKRMNELVNEARVDPYIQNMARGIVRHCPHKDYHCFGDAILQRVKQVIAYVPDPKGIERIQDPWATLLLGTGDCDDYVILINALAASVGFNTGMITVKAQTDPGSGEVLDQWSHVLSALQPPGEQRWYGADGIVPESTFGWEPPNTYEKKIWA